LTAIINPVQNLDWIESEFLKEDIDKVIAELPNNKSPGPDGFNGEFLKKCWPSLAQDFYDLCKDFSEGSVCLRSINSSYITLIPKKDCPLSISDFRPISLLNSSIKLLTKLLADRLQKVIISLVHANQYGFIKTRSIQDCLAWAFEFIHLCKFRKKEAVILKLDFEKALDKIEHQDILHMLQSKGFGPKWIGWIKNILDSGTSSVLLNGVPGKVFQCKRGVRQGDPLSPLLFVLTADLLQSLVNQALQQGLLRLPIPERAGSDFPIVQYADDTLLILEACPSQLLTLKQIVTPDFP
jgi:mannosylglycoprotein endo-beta-mannosidase